MNKERFYLLLFILMLLLNVGIISFFLLFRHGHNHKPHQGPRDTVIKELNFNKEQIEKYDLLIEIHRAEMRKIEDSIDEVKTTLYHNFNTDNNVQNDSLLTVIGNHFKNREHLHLSHFNDIKKLCTPEQIPLYETLSKEFPKMFHPHRRGRHPHPH